MRLSLFKSRALHWISLVLVERDQVSPERGGSSMPRRSCRRRCCRTWESVTSVKQRKHTSLGKSVAMAYVAMGILLSSQPSYLFQYSQWVYDIMLAICRYLPFMSTVTIYGRVLLLAVQENTSLIHTEGLLHSTSLQWCWIWHLRWIRASSCWLSYSVFIYCLVFKSTLNWSIWPPLAS